MYHVPQVTTVGQAQRTFSAMQTVQQGTLCIAADIRKGSEAGDGAEGELQEQ